MSSRPPETTPDSNYAPIWRCALPTVGLLLLCFSAYWPLLHAGYIWDDNVWLTDNPLVQHWNGLWDIWFIPKTSTQYYPLVYTAFLLQFKMWGLNPMGYHLVNIALQAVNSILLWRILRLLGLKVAWLAAAIFAIHPLQVETVGWVTEQKNLLSAAFGLSAALLWIKWAELDVTGKMPVPPGSTQAESLSYNSGQGRSYVNIIAATVLFVLALLSKTDICTLPVVLLLLAWWKQGRVTRVEILSVIPWILIGVLLACLTVSIEHGSAGAHGQTFDFSLSQRTIIAGKDFWFYPFKLLWPHPLLAVYPRWDADQFTPLDGFFPATAYVVPALLLLLYKKIGRGPFTGFAFYAITISPVLGFISFYTMEYTFVADHYQYLACIGLIVPLVELGARLLSWGPEKLLNVFFKHRVTVLSRICNYGLPTACSIVVLGLLGTTSYAQCQLYHPPVNIWWNVLRYDSNSWVALDQIGEWQSENGEYDKALATFSGAINAGGGSDVYTTKNMGGLLIVAKHDYHDAIEYLVKSLRIDPYQPDVISELAFCYEQLGDMQNAIWNLKHGLDYLPNDPLLHRRLGEDLERLGSYQAALEQFTLALQTLPDDAQSISDRNQLLEKLKQTQKTAETGPS